MERASHFSPAIAASRIATLRRNILTFKDYLRLLHTLIKPAATHTLSIPAPLVNLARDHLHQIEGMKTAGVVVLLTPQLMFFQRPHGHVKWQAARAENLIPQAAKFPPKLGFIELPFLRGQASSIILPSITRLDISFTRSYQPYHLRTLRLPTSNRLPIKR